MDILRWLTGHFSHRGKALSLYRRGMVRAKKHDHQGAIDDYTTTIGMPNVPTDVRAMALYNRALVHVAMGDERKGIKDLEAVLAMDESLVNVKTMARQKLARMETRSHKGSE